MPSGPIQFQSPQSNAYPSPYLSPLTPSNVSTSSNFSSTFGSPTTSTYSWQRRESAAAEAEWRRRTWHPSTYTYTNYSRPATSGLSYYQTPDAPRPAFAPQAATAASQPHRLPGIETFDQIPRRQTTPPARGPSPMQIDPATRPQSILVRRRRQILDRTIGEDTHHGICLCIRISPSSILQVEPRRATPVFGLSRTLRSKEVLTYRPINRCKQLPYCIKSLKSVFPRLPTIPLQIE